ncbi:TIGR02300 family protein [Shimia sagamensis]|uniref:TIGR02300 family protein n=1 Tax=Shimia sagamensis TaxID=1566352 RepID=A0ABY1NUA6_9RHOB|nr:TIGR02300 family protein [Shimia sagamensis]SMP17180.1 TIGR02300 family protein [Shimia sagamensis]
MPNEEWGVKRVCPTTGKRFYDLNKNPVISPYTGDVVEVEAGKSRMIAADQEDAATLKAKAKDADSADDVLEDDDDTVDLELEDDVLDDDDDEDDNVSLDEIADVAADDEEN